MTRLFAWCLAACAAGACGPGVPLTTPPAPFVLEEATIGIRPECCGNWAFWRNQLAEQLDHSTSSRDLLPFVSQERRELLVAVDLAELNLSEGDEPIQQRQRGRLGAEGGLGLGSATEFPIEIL